METHATRVLIVEDDEHFAEYLRLHLLAGGYAVSAIARNGADALAAIQTSPPDIATIDILLDGDSDGIETAARIRASIDIPILFLTAHQDRHLFERAKSTNPAGYLLKPFNERELRLSIELALHRHRVAHQREHEHEVRHEQLFRASPQPMWICDRRDGTFLDVNDAAVANYGYTREQFLAMTLDAVRVDSAPDGDAGDRWSGFAAHCRADGTRIMVEASSHPLDYNGRPAQLMLLIDVTRRLAAEIEVRSVSQQYRTLSARLLSVQEEERRHIARELHDEIGQSLTALKIALQSLATHPETQPYRPQIDVAVGIADNALAQTRQLSLDLRPPQLDDLGLAAAIRWNLERQGQLAGVDVSFASDAVPRRVPETVAIACYRISQEAITNAVRHAAPRRIEVRLWCANATLHLDVRDDGCGFVPAAPLDNDPGRHSMGIAGMRERAALAGGRLELQTAPAAGCTVSARFPAQCDSNGDAQ